MIRHDEARKPVPKLDVSIAGVFLPRGRAIPLIVQIENARAIRESGVFFEAAPEDEPNLRSAA